MNCWFCYWGWPRPIQDIYDRALAALNGYTDPLHYGPAHIVWEDENFDAAEYCLSKMGAVYWGDIRDSYLPIVRQSLVELIAVPDEYKRWPEAYEATDSPDANPADYPPPAHWEMVR